MFSEIRHVVLVFFWRKIRVCFVTSINPCLEIVPIDCLHIYSTDMNDEVMTQSAFLYFAEISQLTKPTGHSFANVQLSLAMFPVSRKNLGLPVCRLTDTKPTRWRPTRVDVPPVLHVFV